MRHIALTGSNSSAVAKVAEMLVDASRTGGLGLTVHIGVNDARQASTLRIEQPHSELWRVGLDSGRPELDDLVDRTIPADSPLMTAASAARALRAFIGKTAIA